MATPTTPILNITIFDSHDRRLLVVGDSSIYPTGWNIVSPTLQITIPGYPAKQIPFDARDINIYNSNMLGITCDADDCDLEPLPDGVYTLKYAIAPALTYNTTRTFLRVEALYEKFDEKFLSIELFTCDSSLKRGQKSTIDLIEYYVQGAIAAGNRCANKLALELYQKASSMLDKFPVKTT